MRTVVWRPQASSDFFQHIAYIAAENPHAAQRLASKLLLATKSLAVFPGKGRPGALPATRELTTTPPFIIVYEILPEEIGILRIWHAAQSRQEDA
ncbi:hypothetical protein IP70_07440 [alpha proteobacterium AAP38]|nr:hypothetical protein IP70_07440 [alpha proteobacterium AAP38]